MFVLVVIHSINSVVLSTLLALPTYSNTVVDENESKKTMNYNCKLCLYTSIPKPAKD